MKIKPLFLISITTMLTFITACTPSTPAPTETPRPITATPVPPTSISLTPTSDFPSQDPNCTDEAVFIADMTIPDDTKLTAGEAFVKTWKVRNSGTCIWNEAYSLAFASGDQMSSPPSVPLRVTAPGETLQISVSLVAPTTNGIFTGIYQLKNARGDIISIGKVDNIWLRIIVDDGAVAIPPTSPPSGPCTPERNPSYESDILTLINNVRANHGLSTLSINAQLTAATDAHSEDMACNSLLSHTGSDGSSVVSRIAAQGYSPLYIVEIIYAGGTAQDAVNWWMNDQIHREAILSKQVTEIGIGYAYLGSSTYGGYFAVDLASPSQ